MYGTKLKLKLKLKLSLKMIFFSSSAKLYRSMKWACYMARVGERRGTYLVLAGKF